MLRHLSAELELHEMIDCHTLIGAALKRTQIAPVLPADEIGHIATGLVPGVLTG